MTDSQQDSDLQPGAGAARDRILTIPNLICFLRIPGSVVLAALAIAGESQWFAGLFVALSLSDWIDGKLARWLNQRSDFGARLDSFSDALLYAALFFGMTLLRRDVLQDEAVLLLVAFSSYVLTTAAGLVKYGKVPSYHTYGAKTSQWLILVGAACALLNVSIWPLRVALAAVLLTNLEATLITLRLPEWRADVLSLFHAVPGRCPAATSLPSSATSQEQVHEH